MLNKVAGAAEGLTGVKVDEGEDMKQTMKEKTMEEVMEDKLRTYGGEGVRTVGFCFKPSLHTFCCLTE